MLDGKIADGDTSTVQRLTQWTTRCAKCGRIIPEPKCTNIKIDGCFFHINYYSLDNDFWIYPTRRGVCVSYCSTKCRNKHNHRFNKGK